MKEADILKRRGRLLTIRDSSHRHQREKTGIDPIVFDSKRKQWCHFGTFHIGAHTDTHIFSTKVSQDFVKLDNSRTDAEEK